MNNDAVKPVKGDLPVDSFYTMDVKKSIEDCIYDMEAFILTDSCIQNIPYMEALYKQMELYYRIKLLKKTLDKDIFNEK